MLKYEKNGKTYTCTLYSQIHADEFVKSPAATKKYLEYVRAAGQDVILLTHCEFFAVGEERVRSLETVKRACAAALAAGFRPIVWTSTLGYGGFRDEAFRTRFPKLTRLMNFDGHEDGPVCTTDPVFTAAIQETCLTADQYPPRKCGFRQCCTACACVLAGRCKLFDMR